MSSAREAGIHRAPPPLPEMVPTLKHEGRQFYKRWLTSTSHVPIRFQLSHIRDANPTIRTPAGYVCTREESTPARQRPGRKTEGVVGVAPATDHGAFFVPRSRSSLIRRLP